MRYGGVAEVLASGGTLSLHAANGAVIVAWKFPRTVISMRVLHAANGAVIVAWKFPRTVISMRVLHAAHGALVDENERRVHC